MEDAKEGMTPAGNQQPQPQDATPRRERRFMRRGGGGRRSARNLLKSYSGAEEDARKG